MQHCHEEVYRTREQSEPVVMYSLNRKLISYYFGQTFLSVEKLHEKWQNVEMKYANKIIIIKLHYI